jgi:predicted  nucleic acid-binding Zn-ribbon protein
MDWECRDIILYRDDGVAIYNGPRFLRCTRSVECGELMTHGKLQAQGACSCGGRRFNPALKVLPAEREAILMGDIPLLDWERDMLEEKMREVQAGRTLADIETSLGERSKQEFEDHGKQD